MPTTELLASDKATQALSDSLMFGIDSIENGIAKTLLDIAQMAADVFPDLYQHDVSDKEAMADAILASLTCNGYYDETDGLRELEAASEWCLLDIADYALQVAADNDITITFRKD